MEYIVELQYLNRPKKVVGSAKGTARQKLGSVEIYLKMKEYYRDPAKWPKSEWSSYFIEVQKTGEGWKVISWAGVSKEFKE